MIEFFAFIGFAAFAAYTGYMVCDKKWADRRMTSVIAHQNRLRTTMLPVFHIAAHEGDATVNERAEYDRRILAELGRASIPVIAINFNGIGTDGRGNFGETLPEYYIRVGREVQAIMNAMQEEMAAKKHMGADRAASVFSGQKMNGQDYGNPLDWTWVNPQNAPK